MDLMDIKGLLQSSLSNDLAVDELEDHHLEAIIEEQHDHVLVMAEATADLHALSVLQEYIKSQSERLRNRNLADSVIRPQSVELKDHTQLRLRVLDELRSRAFGKVVAVSDDNGNLHTYRIAQANESCIKDGVTIVNRLAPVAAELVPAEPGDKVDLPNLGECTVYAIALLDRGRTTDAYNFRSLQYDSHDLRGAASRIYDVAETLSTWRQYCSALITEGEPESWSTYSQPEREALEQSSSEALAAHFYTSTTEAQEEIVQLPGHGIVVVEGIAGSGKTSVALGRTKALCDRRFHRSDDDNFDSFFQPERAVGFVLHQQLVDYLKDTRDQLHISDMPVQEYNQLRQSLARSRAALLQLKLVATDQGKYSRTAAEAIGHDGTMSLLRRADALVAQGYGKELRKRVANTSTPGTAARDSFQKTVSENVWNDFVEHVSGIADKLERGLDLDGFSSKGLARLLDGALSRVTNATRGDSSWLEVAIEECREPVRGAEEALAALTKAGCRIGVGRSAGSIEELLPLEKQLDKLYAQREKLFREEGVEHRLGDVSREEIRDLLRQGTLYAQREGRWVRIRCHQDEIISRLRERSVWVWRCDEEPVRARLVRPFSGQENRRLREQVRDRAREVLITPLKLPDLLRKEIGRMDSSPGDGSRIGETLENMRGRLESGKVSDWDLDLLLALAHIISEGYEGEVSGLVVPPYYSTVFIDEVQDFSEVQIFLMAAQADPARRAVTVVGDFCQQLYEGRVGQLDHCFQELSRHPVTRVELARNKRQEGMPALAAFSNWVRETVKALGAGQPVPEAPAPVPGVVTVKTASSPNEVQQTVEEILGHIAPHQSVAVVCPSTSKAKELESHLRDAVEAHFRQSMYSDNNRDLIRPYFVHFTTPLPTKGLEFDVIVAVEFDKYDLTHRVEANSAYVVASRAREALHIVVGDAAGEGRFHALLGG